MTMKLFTEWKENQLEKKKKT